MSSKISTEHTHVKKIGNAEVTEHASRMDKRKNVRVKMDVKLMHYHQQTWNFILILNESGGEITKIFKIENK